MNEQNEKPAVDFWKQETEEKNYEILLKIANIRKQGVDVENFLEIHFPGV